MPQLCQRGVSTRCYAGNTFINVVALGRSTSRRRSNKTLVCASL